MTAPAPHVQELRRTGRLLKEIEHLRELLYDLAKQGYSDETKNSVRAAIRTLHAEINQRRVAFEAEEAARAAARVAELAKKAKQPAAILARMDVAARVLAKRPEAQGWRAPSVRKRILQPRV